MAEIKLKGIQKIYPGNVAAVHDFNLEIKDQEFIVLVGPSGCGKSTTLRMIAGLEDITEGELYIGEQLVNQVHPKDRDIAMVFQNYALYPQKTVYKNMSFGLSLRKVPKDEIDRKVRETARILGIEELLDRKPKALSGGQRQRVALGRAMVRNPAVFLLDEPLSNLDANLRTAMRGEITKLHRHLKTTFVYVTHDQIEAMTMGDRIVVMKDGCIQQADTPQNLYDRPCNVFVAGFIGAPQMNLIPVQIQKKGQRFLAVLGDCELFLPQEKIAGQALEPYVGKTCILGIRPEHIRIKVEPGSDDSLAESVETSVNGLADSVETSVDGLADSVEMMGAELFLHLKAAGNRLIARVSRETPVKEGQQLRFLFDQRKLHLFDEETQQVIFN